MADTVLTPDQQKQAADVQATLEKTFGAGSPVAVAGKGAAERAATQADQLTGYGQPGFDQNFEYGGWAGGAAEAAGRYAGLGAAAQGRQGEQINTTNIDADRGLNLGARGQSMSMAQLLSDRANGKMPLISGMRADQDTNRALADQTSIAAGARGPAALALAQQNQANNSAAAVSNISNSAQINGAQEQLNNTLAAGQAFNNIRGGDQSLQNTDAGTAIAQSNLNANQRAENDKYQLGMTGYETGVQNAQLGASENKKSLQFGTALAYGKMQQDQANANRAATQQIVGTIANVGSAGVGSIATGAGGGGGSSTGSGAGAASSGAATDGVYNAGSSITSVTPDTSGSNPDPNARADGGPVEAGKPYLVGERGPEMIVPARDGHVLTAEQTRAVAPPSRVDAFLDGIHPLSYHYKQPGNEPRSEPTGGRYLGISAQDLEKVPEVGRQMVSEGPRGKQVEVGPSLSAALAGIARLNERLKTVEGGGHITSDMVAKTDVAQEGAARAWDQGHNATIENVGMVGRMSPEELRASPRPEAQAVRGIKADAFDEGFENGHSAGMAALLKSQHAAAGRAMDAANAEHAAARQPREPFDDSLSRYNPVEAIRGFVSGRPEPKPVQQRGAPIMHEPPPSGSFDAQVRDRFGGPPPGTASGPVASNDMASLLGGRR